MDESLERNAEQLTIPTRSSSSQIHIHHHHHYHRRNGSDGAPHMKRDVSTSSLQAYRSLKSLTLNNLDAKQHFLIAVCRDVSLLPPLLAFANSLKRAWSLSYDTNVLYTVDNTQASLTTTFKMLWQAYRNSKTQASSFESDLPSQLITARSSEYLLCSLWCMVSAYLTYSVLDSLMVRWIVKYSTIAAILRMFSMSLLFITLEMLLLSSLSPNGDYYLHTWILISCMLTGAYIWQSFLTSNLNYVSEEPAPPSTEPESAATSSAGTITPNFSSASQEDLLAIPHRKKKKSSKSLRFTKNRQNHLYNITVFCVVPVGVASFVTMIGLLRNLVIQRLDVEQLERILREAYRQQN